MTELRFVIQLFLARFAVAKVGRGPRDRRLGGTLGRVPTALASVLTAACSDADGFGGFWEDFWISVFRGVLSETSF